MKLFYNSKPPFRETRNYDISATVLAGVEFRKLADVG
jgi:hypothetical protein